MKKPKDTNPAAKAPITDTPNDNLSPEEKIRSLEAENLRLQQIIVKGYGAATSIKNELKALLEDDRPGTLASNVRRARAGVAVDNNQVSSGF